MAITKAKLIADGVITVDNLHESHGITTTHIGEGNKLFYTDTRVSNYLSANNYITTGDVPNLETVTSLSISANILSYTNEAGVTTNIDLSTYLDDTNLARLVSGTLNAGTGIATFTRDDSSTFTIDFSAFLADANDYVSSGSFNTSTGVLTLTRLGGGTVMVDLDGKYAEAVHTHDDRYYTELESDGRFAPISHTHLWSHITDRPTALSAFTNDLGNYGGFLTSFTETDPIYTASSWYTTTNNASNWNTAYSWGNHANAGYITGYTETDTLASVTARGSSSSANITLTGQLDLNKSGTQLKISRSDSAAANWFFHSWASGLNIYPDAAGTIYFGRDGSATNVDVYNGTLYQQGNAVIHAGNIGSQSVNYATNSTKLYASDAPYTINGTNPYYMYMNYDGGSYWELKVSPATPGTVKVAYSSTAGSVAWSNVSSKPALWYQSGSWLGDLGSNGFTRESGLSMTGGSEFVVLSKSGQGYTLVDGGYFAYEASSGGSSGGFWSSYNSSYGTASGFRATDTDLVTFIQADGGSIGVIASGNMRAPIFYDSNNTGYYLDPTSTTWSSYNLGGARFRNIQISSSDLTDTIQNATAGGNLWLQYGHNGPVGLGYGGGLTTIYSGLSLNSADTAKIRYLPPGTGTVNLGAPFYNNVSFGAINIAMTDNDTGGIVIDNEGATIYGAGDAGEVFRVIDEDVWQTNGNNIDGATTFKVNQGADGGTRTRGTSYATGDHRAPIFYDSDNTGYYINPNSQSNVDDFRAYSYRGNGNVGGTGTASWHPDGIYCGSTMWQYGSQYKNDTGIYDLGEIKFTNAPYIQKYNTRNLIIRSHDNSDSGILGRGSSGQFAFQIYGNGGGDYGFLGYEWGDWDIRKVPDGRMYLNNNNDYYLQTNDNSYVYRMTSAADARAPIFYDQNDTGYYVDPNGTSRLNSINTNDGNIELYKEQTIDMSGAEYSTSNYYPVMISVPTSGAWIQIQNNLNSNAPSWANHGSGFTLNLRWWTNGSGWGTTEVNRRVTQYHERFANLRICGGITQMGTSSQEVVYLRGGGVYYFRYSRNLSGFASSTNYTNPYGVESANVTSSPINDVWNSKSGYQQVWGDAIRATADLHTPIIYDWNDSNYYLDPNSSGTCFRGAGSINVNGDVTAYYSDMRLKTKIADIKNPIEKVKSLTGFIYEPNEIAQSYGYKKEQKVGVSAQEVQAVLPEAVKDAPIGNGYLTVQYDKLVPLLIEAIKEQQKQIEELKSIVNGITK